MLKQWIPAVKPEKEELEKAKERRRTYIAEYKRQREAGLR